MANPKCQSCGKVLVGNWHPNDEFWAKHLGRSPIKTKVHMARSQYESEYAFYDTYGYDDSNLFCSLRCGFRWAVHTINRIKKDEITVEKNDETK
jgi:hypothetical protein